MVNILSTIELSEETVALLKEHREDIEYRYVRSKDLGNNDYSWAHVLNTYGSHIKHHDIKDFTELKWLNVMSAGVDSLPFEDLKDIPVTNARGIHKIPMMEYTIGLILNHYKNFYQNKVDQNSRFWNNQVSTEELYGKNVHIFGTGSIGSHIAKVLQVFGAVTTGYNTTGRAVEGFDKTHSIEEKNKYVDEADIVISILPKTKDTDAIFDDTFFETMKDSGIFINIGRGNVVTDDVLLNVLENKVIGHMILDVFNLEPLPGDSPFFNYENITITPHSSATTHAYYDRAAKILGQNLTLYPDFERMENLVDKGKGY